MNKNGQSLVLFVIILPIFLFSCALIVDVGLMINAKIKATNLLSYAVEEKIDVEEYFNINGINLKNVNYIEKNNKDCVIINYDIRSVFGNILGYKKYNVKVEKCNEKEG